jgi:hypothetical protein
MLTLILESGSPQNTTFHSVFRRLPRHTNVARILAKLGQFNAATVTLADGTKARLELTADEARPELFEDRSHSLALPATHHAHCVLLLGLDVYVQCTARDEIDAEHLIEATIRGERAPPPGFSPMFKRTDVETFIGRLEVMVKTGNITQPGVTDVLVTGFEDPMRLEYQP